MRRVPTVALDVVLALLGIGALIYGDLTTNRVVRIVGVVVVTLAVIGAAILAVLREHDW